MNRPTDGSDTDAGQTMRPRPTYPVITNRNPEQAQGLDKRRTIDQIIQHLPHNCRLRTTSGFSFSTPTPTGTLYVHAPCNQLTCRCCAHVFYHQVHPALCQAFHDHALRFLVSLTLPGNTPINRQEIILKKSLQRLLQYAKRTFPDRLHYAWVIGTQSNGRIHAHMVVNTDLRRASHYGHRTGWLKSTWHHLTGSHQVKVAEITLGTEPNVVQYLLQNIFETVLAEYVRSRKYGSSRSIKFRPARPEPTGTWERHRQPTAHYARLHGIDKNPIMNGNVIVNDAGASSTPSRAEAPLDRSAAAGGATGPAGAAGGVGVPVPLLQAPNPKDVQP